MTSSTIAFVLDYSCNVVDFLGETLATFSSNVFHMCIFILGLLNEVFDGALLEVLIGASCWLLYVLFERRRPRTKAEAGYVKLLPCDRRAPSANKAKVGAVRKEIPTLNGTSCHTPEVQQFVSSLLGRAARQAPGATLDRYHKLVRQHGVDLSAHLHDERHVHTFYLALAACSKGRSSLSGPTQEATWIQRLLNDMRRFHFPRSHEFYSAMAKMYANDHLWQDIVEIQREMTFDGIEPDRGLLICFMSAAMACKANQQVLQNFDKLKKFGPPAMRSYMTVLNIYKNNGDCCGAIGLLEDMEALDIEPDTLVLNQVLSLCVEGGKICEVEKLLKRWHSHVDVISCNTLIKGYAHQADLSKAEAMLQSMLVQGPPPNLVTFNTIMDCSIRASSLQHGGYDKSRKACHGDNFDRKRELAKRPWHLLDQLMDRGLEPDRYTCSILVKGLHSSAASCDDIDRTIALLRRLGPTVLQPDSRNEKKNNLRLVEVLFNTLLDICASGQELDRISDIFGMMKEYKVNMTNITFGILMKAFGQAGNLDRCHEAWHSMLKANIKPTVVTYGAYIDACMRSSDVSTAEKIYSSMVSTNVHPNAVIYTSLIRGLAASGHPAKAFKYYRQMRQDGVEPTSVTFNSVLDMVVRQLSEPKILESVLDDMHIVNAAPDVVVCTILLKASCAAGNIDKAIALFRQIRGISHDHAAMSSLLLACARMDRVADAKEVFQDMCQLGIMPNAMTASILIKMYGRARMPDRAEAVIETIQCDLGAKPSPQVYTSLIQVLFQDKSWQRTLDAFSRMSRAGVEPDAMTLATVVQSCINLGHFDHALSLVRQASLRFQPDILHNLLEAMRRKGCHGLIAELEKLISEQHSRKWSGY